MSAAYLLRQTLVALALVLGLATAGLVLNLARPGGLPLYTDWAARLAHETASTLEKGITAIDAQGVRRAMANGALVLDARPADFFALERIPGSLNAPVGQAERLLPALVAGWNKQAPIITYCEGGACADSVEVARLLAGMGFTNVAVYTGGIIDWTERNLPIEGEGP